MLPTQSHECPFRGVVRDARQGDGVLRGLARKGPGWISFLGPGPSQKVRDTRVVAGSRELGCAGLAKGITAVPCLVAIGSLCARGRSSGRQGAAASVRLGSDDGIWRSSCW